MATGNFKVKADSSSVMRAMSRLKASFDDMSPLLSNAAVELTKRAQARFVNKTDPDGNAWAPWSASTAKRYTKFPERQLMVNTMQLEQSVKFVPGPKGLRAVVGMPYGVFHEQPFGHGNGKIPRRAFLFSTRNGGRALAIDDEQYLLNALRYQIRKAAKA